MTKIEPRIEKLFMCLAASKHMKFTSAYPTEGSVNVAKLVWQNGLADLTDAELAVGIKALANWTPENSDERLPTLTEFKNLLCPRIRNSAPRLEAPSREYKPASHQTVVNCWKQLANSSTLKGKLKTAVNKIAEKYQDKHN